MERNPSSSRKKKGWVEYDEYYGDSEYEDDDGYQNEYASGDLIRGLGNWLTKRRWETCALPTVVTNRGTDRFGLYHEFDWHSVVLPDTNLAGNLRMHVHLGPLGNQVISGAIWVVGHSGSSLKSHEFHELDDLANWLSQKFAGVWFGVK